MRFRFIGCLLPVFLSIGNISFSQKICKDTSTRFFFENKTINFHVNSPAQTADGNFLLCGSYNNIGPYFQTGSHLIKLDFSGNILWHKSYDSLNNLKRHYLEYHMSLELLDGSILLAGYSNNGDANDIILSKTDQLGNILWSKTYTSKFWTGGVNATDYRIQQIKQDKLTGDVFLTSPYSFAGLLVARLNQFDGAVLWSKTYQTGGLFDRPFGIDIKYNEVRVFSKKSNDFGTHINIIRINKSTGDTLQTKLYKSNDITNHSQFAFTDQLKVLNDGNYVVTGGCQGNNDLWNGAFYKASVVEFDSNLNFTKAYSFRNRIANTFNERVTINPDGTGVFCMFETISPYTNNVYYVQFKNEKILKQRKINYKSEGGSPENESIRTPDGGDIILKELTDSVTTYMTKLEFLKIHTWDTLSSCLGINDSSTYIYPFTYALIESTADSIKTDVFLEGPTKSISTKKLDLKKSPACFQVSYCDTLNLTSTNSIACLSDSLKIFYYKNKSCESDIVWRYDSSVINNLFRLNDSTFYFQFNKPWTGYIYGSLESCTTITDSIYIQILEAPAMLNLGPDTSICPNNNILLNAHAGYATYRWQDGSTDSTYNVTKPGIYAVKTTDACGGTYTDTVVVSQRAIAPISVGPNRTKCDNDTLHLTATAGFINYSWSPNYNINPLNSANVIINPLVNTTYFIKAEKTPGCFAFDTINITVNNSAIINLGNDTSFCEEQSVTLRAGNGFISYNWSNGGTTSELKASTAGTYSIIATNANGCKSYDTLIVKNVFVLPVVTLDQNTRICIGTNKILNAGSFVSYRWQDGSSNRTFITNSIGKYYVEVTDMNNCKGSDTTAITTLVPSSANFLPADTLICFYDKIIIKSLGNFSSYNWSTGESSPSVTITQPGLYWLEVRNSENCLGRDSIILQPKECLKGLFVPNAFTPNADGKNDQFRALVFGNIETYDFSIFNRFGQIVFHSTKPSQGWDGSFNGIPQPSGTFVWRAVYKFVDEPAKEEKGSFSLIR